MYDTFLHLSQFYVRDGRAASRNPSVPEPDLRTFIGQHCWLDVDRKIRAVGKSQGLEIGTLNELYSLHLPTARLIPAIMYYDCIITAVFVCQCEYMT